MALAATRLARVATVLADQYGVPPARVVVAQAQVGESPAPPVVRARISVDPRSFGVTARPRGAAMRRLLRFLLWCGLGLVVVASLAMVAVWRELTQDLPAVTELLDYRPPTATRVFAADGTPIGEFYVERRYLLPIAEVPEQVRLAFLAAEDADFYRHPGIDAAGMARALLANLRAGEIVQGASTITQQVVKQLLLSPERSFERKSKELILALELESKLTKDEIFYLYLNHIYFGAGTYGLSAAARSYFDVEPSGLTLAAGGAARGPAAGAEPLRPAPPSRGGAAAPALGPRPDARRRLRDRRAARCGARGADRDRDPQAGRRPTRHRGTSSTSARCSRRSTAARSRPSACRCTPPSTCVSSRPPRRCCTST